VWCSTEELLYLAPVGDTSLKSFARVKPQVIAHLPGQDLWLMWFRDSEDNLLAIMEERKK
jgi:hypothetical protein